MYRVKIHFLILFSGKVNHTIFLQLTPVHPLKPYWRQFKQGFARQIGLVCFKEGEDLVVALAVNNGKSY